MARSNRLIILVGVVLAVAAFIGVVAVLGAQRANDADAERSTRAVLVAAEDIEVGEEVTPGKVQVKEVPSDAIAGTPLADPSMLGNRPAVFAVSEGQQVTQETFGRSGRGALNVSGQLRPGEKAIAFQVDRVTGLDFILQQGDLIDVVLSADVNAVAVDGATGNTTAVSGLENQRTVKTVLQAKRVLYVSHTIVGAEQPTTGEESGEDEQAERPPTDNVIIIVAGSDQDAELIKFAQRDIAELGAISVTLRGAGDAATEQTTGVTLDRLISEYGVPAPNVVILPESTPAP